MYAKEGNIRHTCLLLSFCICCSWWVPVHLTSNLAARNEDKAGTQSDTVYIYRLHAEIAKTRESKRHRRRSRSLQSAVSDVTAAADDYNSHWLIKNGLMFRWLLYLLLLCCTRNMQQQAFKDVFVSTVCVRTLHSVPLGLIYQEDAWGLRAIGCKHITILPWRWTGDLAVVVGTLT